MSMGGGAKKSPDLAAHLEVAGGADVGRARTLRGGDGEANDVPGNL